MAARAPRRACRPGRVFAQPRPQTTVPASSGSPRGREHSCPHQGRASTYRSFFLAVWGALAAGGRAASRILTVNTPTGWKLLLLLSAPRLSSGPISPPPAPRLFILTVGAA